MSERAMGERPENETSNNNQKEDTPCKELPSAVEYLPATLKREREVRGKRAPGRTPTRTKRGREAEQQEEGGEKRKREIMRHRQKETEQGTSLLFLSSADFRSVSCCRSSRACDCFRLRTGVVIHALHDFSSELYFCSVGGEIALWCLPLRFPLPFSFFFLAPSGTISAVAFYHHDTE